MSSLIDFDVSAGQRWVLGADEAGRGCGAGPLVAAAVLLDYRHEDQLRTTLADVNDSKRLTAAKRERLLPVIFESAAAVKVVSRSAAFIDKHGIQHANLDALARATQRALPAADGAPVRVLIDGFRIASLPVPHEQTIKGDSRSAAIAAASVIAKTIRDRMMIAIDAACPGYGLARHAGYLTAAHLQALRALGPGRYHRRSFRRVGRD